MRPITFRIKADACYPTVYDPTVLSRRYMQLQAHSARKGEVCCPQTLTSDPCLDGYPGPLGKLELYGSSGLLLIMPRSRTAPERAKSPTRRATRSQPRCYRSLD